MKKEKNELEIIGSKNMIVLNKPNQLIEIIGQPPKKIELLTYNFILHKLQKNKTDQMIISLDEIFESIGMSANYQDIYNYLDSLQEIRVTSRDAKGRLWGGFSLLAEYRKEKEGVFIQVSDTIFKALCSDKEEDKILYYTAIQILEESLFSSSHSIVFYEIFKKYEKINIPVYSLAELREMTGTTDKYKVYADFKRYVLDKALEELNDFFVGFHYSYEEIYLSRRVNKIKFNKIEMKHTLEVQLSPNQVLRKELSDKVVKAIEDARHGKYFNEAFSISVMMKLTLKFTDDEIIKVLRVAKDYNQPIINLGAFMIAKLEDIRNSKMSAIKDKHGNDNHQEPVMEAVIIDSAEPKKTDFELLKSKVTQAILEDKGNGNKTFKRFEKLVKLETLENIKQFIIDEKLELKGDD